MRRVLSRPGLYAFEAAYDPWSRLPEHAHADPLFTYVLEGSYVERAGQNARRCVRGAVIFHDRESHQNEVGAGGTVSFNVELDLELWRELTDGIGVLKAIAGRVLGGDIEWPALHVWREFLQADSSSTLGVEEAIALLCEATRSELLNGYSMPPVLAVIELNRDQAQQALELLKPALGYEFGPYSLPLVYVRGEAYLKAGDGQHAAAEFQKIIDHRIVVTNDLLGALAHLQLGRAYVMQSDAGKAKAAYQDFLTLWKDADPDIPVLKQAKAEYAKLQLR